MTAVVEATERQASEELQGEGQRAAGQPARAGTLGRRPWTNLAKIAKRPTSEGRREIKGSSCAVEIHGEQQPLGQELHAWDERASKLAAPCVMRMTALSATHLVLLWQTGVLWANSPGISSQQVMATKRELPVAC